MNDDTPFDPFSDAGEDLSEFAIAPPEQNKQVSTVKKHEVDKIRKAAETAGFTSRQPSTPPPSENILIRKTASLFSDEYEIIAKTQQDFLTKNPHLIQSKPSDSDVIRSALHVFKTLSVDERMALLSEHRGRGRK